MNGGEKVANRKRKFVLRVPVTPEERVLIQQKMAQLGTKNFSAYARKMLIDGYIVHIDTGPVRAQTAELQKIGVNINQIARRINSTGTVYAQDLEDIKGALAQICFPHFGHRACPIPPASRSIQRCAVSLSFAISSLS